MKKTVAISLILALAFAVPAFADMNIYEAKKSIASTATPEVLGGDVDFYDCVVCADTNNTGVVALGGYAPEATAGSQKGTILSAGECRYYGGPDSKNGNLSKIYADVSVNGEDVSIEYRKRR